MFSVIIIGGLGLVAQPLIDLNGPSYSSVFQGIIRWNGFVFIPVVRAVFGPEGLSIVHFWALSFMYMWVGTHHLHWTALPDWASSPGPTACPAASSVERSAMRLTLDAALTAKASSTPVLGSA